MSLILQPSYTSKRGHYTPRELQYLALSLGHDEKLFDRVIKKLGLSADSYSDAEIASWLDYKYLDDDLHFVFNRHSSKYNAKVIKKSMYYLKHRHLTFSELSNGRQVYEMATVNEPFQLPMDIQSVSGVLRLCDRILPPLRMQSIFHSMKRSLDTPGKIKLYEFFEILGFADKIISVRHEMTELEKCGKLKESFYDETETEYEQLSRFLNDKYKASILKPERKFVRSEVNVINVQAIMGKGKLGWKRQTKQEREDYSKLNSLMANSTQLLAQARAGYHVLSVKQGNDALVRLQSPQQQRKQQPQQPKRLVSNTQPPPQIMVTSTC